MIVWGEDVFAAYVELVIVSCSLRYDEIIINAYNL